MLATRRALFRSARSCLPSRSLPNYCLNTIIGERLSVGSSSCAPCGKSTRRNFGARIRRGSDKGQPAFSSEEVGSALASALSGEEAAVRRLATLAAGTGRADASTEALEAEDALHRVLLEVSGEHCDEIRRLAEESLQMCWHESGDAEVNDSIRRGVALMDKDHHDEAARLFTDVIEKYPDYAEGWNKRATARFLNKDLKGAIEDCQRVLALKPRHFGCLSGAGLCHQSGGELKEAASMFRRALAVHPGMDGPRTRVKAMEAQVLINEHLRPRIVSTVQELNDGASPPPKLPAGLTSSWDIWREESGAADGEEPAWKYLLRLRIMNQTDGESEVRSLARFYVFRFADGRMLPLTLLTEGPASFTLAPGEDYRFSWQLISGQELHRAVAGMLLRQCELPGSQDAVEEEAQVLLDADLGACTPLSATQDEVERMRLGYANSGRLDVRRMEAAISSMPKQTQTE